MKIPFLRAAAGLMPALALLAVPPTPLPDLPAFGTIEGHVRDQLGAPIGNAQITIIGTARSAMSDSAGHYRLRRVPAGTYTLRGAFIGYRAVRVEGVVVADGATTLQHISLKPSTVELQDIAVVTAAPLVPRDEVSSKQRVDGDFVDQIPELQPGIIHSYNSREEASVSVGASSAEFGNVRGGRIDVRDARIRRQREPWNTEEYSRIYENRFLAARTNPLSTFSIDVDRASYSNVRRFILDGRLPPADAVRIEELVNYFTYDYAEPSGGHPFTVATDIGRAPWNSEHRLVRIGLQGKRYASRELPPSNLVFLIDVSGSMSTADKLPLVKQAFRLLVRQLRADDRVAIVVYAGSAGLVLPSTSGAHKQKILSAIDRLDAGGSTAGGAGIRLAYQVARENHLLEGNNRVILATDGDFNVGTSSEGELVRLIEEKREQGTYLTILGFGTGNYKDGRMEQLADKGNGNYAYVDNILEAQKVFGTELTATLFTIAKDVKLQVEFNPARVGAYRLIGYENRMLAKEDFADDTKDAGELGAGHTVTALYEIVPVGSESDVTVSRDDSLRYQRPAAASDMHDDEWLTVKLRYKPPLSESSRLLSHTVRDRDARGAVSGDFAFAASVAGFGMVLRDSEFKGSMTFDRVLELARSSRGEDQHGYRAEFIRLVEMARTMDVAVRSEDGL